MEGPARLICDLGRQPCGVSRLAPDGFARVWYIGPVRRNLILLDDWDDLIRAPVTYWILPDSTILHREVIA